MWVLNFSDAQHSLLEIAERATLPFAIIRQAADLLVEKQLLADAASDAAADDNDSRT